MAAEIGNGRNTVLRCLAGAGTGGFIIARAAADEGEIIRFAVRKDMRRQGMGKALLTAALADLAGRGAARVFLEVRVSNRAAVALYKKNGFRLTGVRRKYYKNPREDALCMSKEL